MPPFPHPMTAINRRALVLVGAVFILYGALVAANEGEFWPFSIYPMFSQAGRPWHRAVVREVPPGAEVRWDTLGWATLPGTPYGTQREGRIDAIDVANFVGKTKTWTPQRARALGALLLPPGDTRHLVVMRASGRIVEGDSIAVAFVPYVYLTADRARINPVLLP